MDYHALLIGIIVIALLCVFILADGIRKQNREDAALSRRIDEAIEAGNLAISIAKASSTILKIPNEEPHEKSDSPAGDPYRDRTPASVQRSDTRRTTFLRPANSRYADAHA